MALSFHQHTPAAQRLWNRNFIAVCTANFLLFFAFYILLPMLPLYLRDTFDADRSVVGMILSGYTLTALFIRPFGGFIVDSYPRKTILMITYFLFFIFFAGYIIAGTIILFAVIRGLHGFAFGAVTVANSTMAIDVMPPEKRGEGIGYYGVSNNLAMAVGPSLSMYMYDAGISASYIFATALISAGIGFILDSTVKARSRDTVTGGQPLSLDRFFLTNSIPESMMVIFLSFAYGILSTYLAIYGKEEVGIDGGSGPFFMLLAIGLIAARLISAKWVKRGQLTLNIGVGMIVAIIGFVVFIFLRNDIGFYLSAVILGAGYGAMCPSFQTVFIDLAPNSRRGTANSTYLTSWDIGVGAGVLAGGFFAEHFSYHHAYMAALAMCIIGTLFFFTCTISHFNSHKLR